MTPAVGGTEVACDSREQVSQRRTNLHNVLKDLSPGTLARKKRLGLVSIQFSVQFLFCHFREEADEFVEIGALNGLFVLGRSIGFIGTSA